MIPPLSLIKNIHIVEVFLNKEAFTDKICKGEIRITLHSCLCPLFQCKLWTLAFSAAVKHLTRDTCFLCCNTTIYTHSIKWRINAKLSIICFGIFRPSTKCTVPLCDHSQGHQSENWAAVWKARPHQATSIWAHKYQEIGHWFRLGVYPFLL